MIFCYVLVMPRKSRIDAPGALHHIIARKEKGDVPLDGLCGKISPLARYGVKNSTFPCHSGKNSASCKEHGKTWEYLH